MRSRQPADEASKLKVRQLRNVVDEMSIAAGLPPPAVYVVPDQDPNAFATGRGPGHASIAVTRGLLETLDREELQGVVAHEMSHIRNLDVRLMTVVAALTGAVALLADWARRGMMWGRRPAERRRSSRRRGLASLFFAVWIVAILLAPIVARMLATMVSRRREYLADATGAELTRNPLGLARALEKLEEAVEPTRAIKQGSAHLCIADPLGRQINLKDGILVGYLRVASTHGRAHRRAEGDGVSGEGRNESFAHWHDLGRHFHDRDGLVVGTDAAAGRRSDPGLLHDVERRQLERERDMKASPSAKAAEADFDVMTAEPHHTGSPYEIKLADYVVSQFKSFGIEADKYEYSVLLPWPGQRRIDIVAPDQVKLDVEEEKIRGDQWADKPGILPAYNAYSPSGDVTGEVVYVNFGVPADYETLQKLGIDVKGKIVLARYGGSWRGIKPKVAAEHGAIACIIYSDPHEDGYAQGDVYPEGPFRGWGMIQRGSVMDMPRYPGDPSTPGRPSKSGVERIPIDKIETFAPIPVQPMSYRDGIELLKRLKGPVAPEAWRGSLPTTYHIGPGPAKVHMKLQMDYAQRRLINVVGRIAGAVAPDEWIIVGSHRDAWTFGASDSVSGHVSMMAVARAMGEMMKKGWRPRRSVLFVSWDGENRGCSDRPSGSRICRTN
jgi:Zn-dependent protease with chaperone function